MRRPVLPVVITAALCLALAVPAAATEPIRGARIQWDPAFGTPRTIIPANGTLTEANSGAPTDIARDWLTTHRDTFGLSTSDIADLVVTQDHRLPSGSHVVNLAQTKNGVRAVHGGSMTVVVRPNGAVESYAGRTTWDTSLKGAWLLGTTAALQKVAGGTAKLIGEKAGFDAFDNGSYARRTIFPTPQGHRAAFQVLYVKAHDEAYDVTLDAVTGEVLRKASLVDHAEGTVYPHFPGAPKGGKPEVRQFGPTWVTAATTLGDNASTYANYSNFLVPADQAPRPVSATGQFNFPYQNKWGTTNGQTTPPSYVEDLNPAATNLFFHHNRIHDEFAKFGFTESAGNFQGNDPILGLVHAGAASGGAPTYTGRDNAYMLTLPDGIPPWSGMFLWEPINDAFEGPYRDGNFDASVIEHEYAHGLSNRYVSAEDGALNSHQSGSMGEGWGDWYALNYLHREGYETKAVVGEYATGNAQRGIRNWSYDANPTTFGDIGYDLTGPEVHADGEIWTATLWDYRKLLVAKFGQAKGSEIAALTVTSGMPRSPVDPSFVDMRDAIELALEDLYHADANYEQIYDAFWTAFAKRGLGKNATTKAGDDVDPVPAFNHENRARNGTLTGVVVNAATGKPVAGARVLLGEFEARSTALRTTSTEGGFSAAAVTGTYPVTVQAPGFGIRTFTGVAVQAGKTTKLQFPLVPNLASKSTGAQVVSATSENAQALLDDSEASSWRATKGANAVIKLATPAKLTEVRVSAYTTSRFEALKDFTLQVSDDGQVWRNALVRKDAFGFQAPRPTAPDVKVKTFTIEPTQASYVRFYADAPIGETKPEVQVAELEVFAQNARGVEPLPPSPPDAPVVDQGLIKAPNPGPSNAPGVTMTDLETNCTFPPAAQGADGWVTKLPESFGDGMHAVSATSSSAVPYDLDLYFYDSKCRQIGSAASSATNESGTLPSGARYVLTHLWSGAAAEVTVTAIDTQ
ncbi:hypothetical protein Lesp02_16600 [Lentzea sp. NBRC 105346]|uniref:M36 family metallopeptidase n=1 Tax=Lentzea sp. NBRC 105346 TaxID=3032205 RepID=UPI0024A147D4|nr:M36 family metallopeptidase [Lentzea sp. NBRC 105346]GLZ29470.1 hypothetical protein Lesp02_16600 [Lentzea sp. NBRC 105346]